MTGRINIFDEYELTLDNAEMGIMRNVIEDWLSENREHTHFSSVEELFKDFISV